MFPELSNTEKMFVTKIGNTERGLMVLIWTVAMTLIAITTPLWGPLWLLGRLNAPRKAPVENCIVRR